MSGIPIQSQEHNTIPPREPTDKNPVDASAAASEVNEGLRNQNRYFSSQFEDQIKSQRSNLWIATSFTIGAFGISILIWLLSKSNSQGGASLEYMKLGPAALSSLTLPVALRMFLSYRLRIPIYRGYKRLFDEATLLGTSVEPHLFDDARDALKAIHKVD